MAVRANADGSISQPVFLTDGSAAQTGVTGNPIVTTAGGSGPTADQIQGNVASGATDAGNPVKVGGVFNTTAPTFTNGQRGDAQIDARGSFFTVIRANGGTSTATVGGAPGDASGGQAALYVIAQNLTFNGTTWDRTRSVTSAVATTGLGIPSAGVMGRFNTTLPTYTDGQYGVAQITSRGQLLTSPGALPTGTDRSGTATTSATTPIAANAARVGLVIQNTGSNNIWYNETGGTAAVNGAGSFLLTPASSVNIRTNQAISVIAITGSTIFAATEW